MCQEYYGFKYPESPSRMATEASLSQELAQLAGGPQRVYAYCAQYVSSLSQHPIPAVGQNPPAAQGAGQGSQGNGKPGAQKGLAGQQNLSGGFSH
jgi:hypothetical protein